MALIAHSGFQDPPFLLSILSSARYTLILCKALVKFEAIHERFIKELGIVDFERDRQRHVIAECEVIRVLDRPMRHSLPQVVFPYEGFANHVAVHQGRGGILDVMGE